MTQRSAILVLLVAAAAGVAQAPAPTVGTRARIEVTLPGPELEAKPIESRDAPLVLRVLRAEPAAAGYRYELEYAGMVPGKFDLRDHLRRKDRTAAAGLPPVPVLVRAVLPPGLALPNPLDAPVTPRPGGYRLLLWVGGVVWAVGLVAILWARRRRWLAARDAAAPVTLADRLRPLVEDALAGKAEPARLAALERTLIAYWSNRLKIGGPPADLLPALKRHAEAGPLLVQLESWLHGRTRGPVDVAALLEPYRHLPADLGGYPA
ncbi:MAG: hypothetical protein ACRC33_09590 [Gemmataceae bacterium]